MTPSRNCAEIIMRAEGLRLKAYKCPADIWTIGYGHTKGVREGDVITSAAAYAFLEQDMAEACEPVLRLCPNVNQNQLDALTSFVYNLGGKQFEASTLRRMVAGGNDTGAYWQFGQWVRGGGKILPGLVKRRAVEAALFRGDPDYMKHFEETPQGAASR